MICKQKTAEDSGKNLCHSKKVSLFSQHGVCKMGWDLQCLMMNMKKKRHSLCCEWWRKAVANVGDETRDTRAVD